MSDYILTRIDAIQQELDMLKQKVLTQRKVETMKEHSQTRLKGIWKGVSIPDELFEEAKQSLMSKELRSKK